MIKRYSLILLFLLILLTVKAQSVNYQIEPEIENVLEKHRKAWSNVKNISGYRIQILALTGTNARTRTMKIKEEFAKSFPKTSCHVSYVEPNFRIRVGDFKTRMEALRELEAIQLKYPGAFIVKDQVSFRDI